MPHAYDKYYQTENLFGKPSPELISFFTDYPKKGKVLDLGCGQGRDAIAIARLGYEVTGIDSSKVGIEQMNRFSKAESLQLVGLVGDIYTFDDYGDFDFILLDSMFHFAKKDKQREIALVHAIISKIKRNCLVVFCIQDTGNKVEILNKAIDYKAPLLRIEDMKFKHTFEDAESGQTSQTDYRLIIVKSTKC